MQQVVANGVLSWMRKSPKRQNLLGHGIQGMQGMPRTGQNMGAPWVGRKGKSPETEMANGAFTGM